VGLNSADTIRARLYAVAVLAFASPRRAAIRRKNAPSALRLRWKFFAANRTACAARCRPGRVALDFTFPRTSSGSAPG